MNCSLRRCITIVAITSLVAVSLVGAQEKKSDVQPSGASPGKVEIEKGSLLDQMQLLQSAGTLIRYGRDNKDAEALIVSARILAGIETQDFAQRLDKGAKVELEASQLSATSLLDEAGKLGAGNAHIQASIAATKERLSEKPRGRIPGPFAAVANFPGQQTIQAPETFSGYNVVHFNSLTPNALLLLEVRNGAGQIVNQKSGPGPWISWSGAGTYQLTLKNLSNFPVQVQIITN